MVVEKANRAGALIEHGVATAIALDLHDDDRETQVRFVPLSEATVAVEVATRDGTPVVANLRRRARLPADVFAEFDGDHLGLRAFVAMVLGCEDLQHA